MPNTLRVYVDIYLKSGTVIRLDHVETWSVKQANGKFVELNIEYEEGVKNCLRAFDLSEVVAIVDIFE